MRRFFEGFASAFTDHDPYEVGQIVATLLFWAVVLGVGLGSFALMVRS